MAVNRHKVYIFTPNLFGNTSASHSVTKTVTAALSATRKTTGGGDSAADRKKGFKQRQFLASATLTPTALHIYNIPEDGYNRGTKFENNKINLKMNKQKGELSEKAAKRIKQAIEWLLIRSTPKPVFNREQQRTFYFRLNFITLTLPSKQQHTDTEIKSRCLNNFLTILRQSHNVTDYLWKAETQTNGNIHFHVTTNTFIHWRDIRDAWTSSLNLLGYIDAFEAKHRHRNPPCTEIRKVKHIRKLAGYLSKYMAKNKSFAPIGELRLIGGKKVELLYTDKAYKDEKAYCKAGKVIGSVLSSRLRKIDANLWGCSQTISKVKPMRFDVHSVQWSAIRKLTNCTDLYAIKGDYVDSYYGEILKTAEKVSPALREDIIAHAKFNEVSTRCTDDKLLQYIEASESITTVSEEDCPF